VKIGFDATNILGLGGIKTYARELIRGLAGEYPDDSFILLSTFSASKKKKLEKLFGGLQNVSVRRAVPHRTMLGNKLFFITRFISWILWRFSIRRLDIVHLTDPFGAVDLPRRFVATIHDIFPLTLDEFGDSDLRSYYRRRTPEILKRAEAVITPSAYVKNSLIDRFPDCKCPIIPIFEAASDDFHPRMNECETLEKYGLSEDQFFLFVGRVDPRKNIPRLIEAYMALPEEMRSANPLALVISGRPPDIEEFRNSFGHLFEGEGPVFLRDVPQEDLYSLYSSALAFVFPTLDEGFGLPVLEAMKSGRPVITSNLSCIPEVTGNAAVLLNPLDTNALSSSMRMMAESPGDRDDYRNRGLERSAEFSWARAARETMAVYRSAVS
jgi:glycosyltransferase involved in cell wall biosynthesis